MKDTHQKYKKTKQLLRKNPIYNGNSVGTGINSKTLGWISGFGAGNAMTDDSHPFHNNCTL
jgi:hypothetical protein